MEIVPQGVKLVADAGTGQLSYQGRPLRAEDILGCPIMDLMWGTAKEIDPDKARQLNDIAPTQRPLRPRAVGRLVKEMQSGDFLLTHQGLAFDEHGKPLDGHHRCQAIVQSGVTVTLFCTFNVPRASFRKIDRNERRTIGDDFVQSGIVNQPNIGRALAAATRVVWTYDHGDNPANEEYLADSADLEGVTAMHPMLVETVGWVTSRRMTVRMPPSVFAAFLTLFREVDNDLAMSFAEQIVTGENSRRGDPAFMLRESMINETNRKAGRQAFMYRIVRAWNAYYRNRSIAKLYGSSLKGAGFPDVEGYQRPYD